MTGMKYNDALVTKAMLASYLSTKNDYIDLILPFVISSLPDEVDAEINVPNLKEEINTNYGLGLDSKTCEKILNRLCGDKYKHQVKREKSKFRNDRRYFVNGKIDKQPFNARKDRMRQLVKEVISNFKSFIETNYENSITLEESQNQFFVFLEHYNRNLYSNIDSIRSIPGKKNAQRSDIRVAKFIYEESQKELGCYNNIQEIQKGYLASTAIYYFCRSSVSDNPRKIIDQTLVFFDTRLLIDALGLNTETEAASMKEFMEMIKNSGGCLCTFDYYVEELAGIIRKYRNDSSSRPLLDLNLFERKKYSDPQIYTYMMDVSEKIKELGFQIISEIDYSAQIKALEWHIDPLELKRNMAKYVSYRYGESDTAYKNDIQTLERISYYKKSNFKFHTKKAIFVTSNHGLMLVARDTFKDKDFRDDVGLVITDINLASVLWLGNYNPKSNLSDLLLLENAYAAVSPDKEMLADVMRIISDNLQSSDVELQREVLILRNSSHLGTDLVELVENGETTVDIDLIKKLSKKAQTRIEDNIKCQMNKRYQKEKDALTSRHNEEIQRLAKENETYANKNKAYISQLTAATKENSDHQNELIIERAKAQDSEKQIERMKEGELSRITNSVRKKCMHLQSLCVWLARIAFIILTWCIIRAAIELAVIDSFHQVLYSIISVIGAICVYIPLFKNFKIFIKKYFNRKYDEWFQKECSHSAVLGDRMG